MRARRRETAPWSIPQTDTRAGYIAQQPAIHRAISRVLEGGSYILGREVESSEAAFDDFVGVARDWLNAAGIGTGIHHPVLLHLQPAYSGRLAAGPSGLGVTERSARQILSLAMCRQLSEEVIDCIISRIRDFLAGLAEPMNANLLNLRERAVRRCRSARDRQSEANR